ATEQEFRQQILQAFIEHKALDFMFDTVKSIALQGQTESENELENKSEKHLESNSKIEQESEVNPR
ncbi:hypothetical protein ODY78_06345, partial [Shewanella xiamenensis]|nr:hypothetical protein [Shewanella xiamenensis]